MEKPSMQQTDDALFDQLKQQKAKKKRVKRIRTLITIAVILALLFVGMSMLRKKIDEQFANVGDTMLSYTVESGTIHTIVRGTGVLSEVDLETVSSPAGVEVTDIPVEPGDTIKKGTVLAAVDMPTVMTALSDVQKQLTALDKKLRTAKDETVASSVTAGVSGRVKRILVEEGMDVSLCMAQHGALVVLSMDGYMALDLEAAGLAVKDSVTVLREDGTSLEGRVESVVGSLATILVTDDGPRFDEAVTVMDMDGTTLGSAKLYIHKPLGVTGYTGSVNRITTKENAKVGAKSSLMKLSNTSVTATFDSLLRDRAELEKTQLELLTIYRDGAMLAPADGRISTVDFNVEDEKNDFKKVNPLLTYFPNEKVSISISIDETDILSLHDGQEADVVVPSVSEEKVFSAVVTDVNKVADTSSGVTRYTAKVSMDMTDAMLPGMTADVDIKIEGVENAKIIPLDALQRTSAVYFVYTSYDPETKEYGGKTEVTIGMQNDVEVEIRTGLNVGDTIYYERPPETFGFGGGGDRPRGERRDRRPPETEMPVEG